MSLLSGLVTATIPGDATGTNSAAVWGHTLNSLAATTGTPTGKVYVTSADNTYMTVIRTDTDIVTASILLQGNGVDVHTSTQYLGTSSTTTQANAITQSRSMGSGAP